MALFLIPSGSLYEPGVSFFEPAVSFFEPRGSLAAGIRTNGLEEYNHELTG
jgi:hypothetical protein